MLLLFLIKSVPSVMASVWSSAKYKDDASDELKRSFQSRYACMRKIRCSKHYRQCFWFGKSGLRSHHRQYTPKVKLTLIRIKSQLSWKIKSPPLPPHSTHSFPRELPRQPSKSVHSTDTAASEHWRAETGWKWQSCGGVVPPSTVSQARAWRPPITRTQLQCHSAPFNPNMLGHKMLWPSLLAHSFQGCLTGSMFVCFFNGKITQFEGVMEVEQC